MMDELLKSVETKLVELFDALDDEPAELHEAMRYAVMSGGKRIRPLLCLASAEAAGGRREDAIYPACAIEILHNYTLVHDDLPAMDNDRLRRGNPTVWAKYGEDTAILVGDALLAFAFQIAARSPRNVAKIISLFGEMGVGVVRGQAEDLALSRSSACADPARAHFVYRHKTADLFVAAAVAGALAAGAEDGVADAVGEYALNLGLAFQYEDDLLDGDGLFGRERAADLADQCTARAVDALDRIPGDTSVLRKLALLLVRRSV